MELDYEIVEVLMANANEAIMATTEAIFFTKLTHELKAFDFDTMTYIPLKMIIINIMAFRKSYHFKVDIIIAMASKIMAFVIFMEFQFIESEKFQAFKLYQVTL